MAKKGQKYRKHSPEFKLSVIMDMRENHLGIMETERKYDVKHNVISKWERIFLEEGAEGLMKERRGRDRKSTRLNSSHKHRSRMPSSA